MSALGHKRTSKRVTSMSALPPKADIAPFRSLLRYGVRAYRRRRDDVKAAAGDNQKMGSIRESRVERLQELGKFVVGH
jgi:hypothetical protein